MYPIIFCFHEVEISLDTLRVLPSTHVCCHVDGWSDLPDEQIYWELSCISSDSFILFELILEITPSLEFNNRLNLYLFPSGKAHGSSNASATR